MSGIEDENGISGIDARIQLQLYYILKDGTARRSAVCNAPDILGGNAKHVPQKVANCFCVRHCAFQRIHCQILVLVDTYDEGEEVFVSETARGRQLTDIQRNCIRWPMTGLE